MHPLSLKVMTWSSALFGAVTYVLCVVYGLIAPKGLHATAVVVLAADGSEQPPSAVEQATGGGHHREAVLVFPAPARPGPVTIVVKDVGGVAMRSVVWEVAAGK
jgi:hypothetical protein